MLRALALGLLATVLAVATAPAATAQDAAAPAPTRYPFEFGSSSVPMLRNAQFFSAAGALTDRALDAVLDKATGHVFQRSDWKGIVARTSRLYLVAMPISSLAQGFNHEYGHIRRDTRAVDWSVQVTAWPWPIALAGFSIAGDWRRVPDSTNFDRMASIAAGSEADHLLADLIIDRVFARDRASYFDLVLYTYAKAYPSFYAIRTTGLNVWDGDPRQYALRAAIERERPFYNGVPYDGIPYAEGDRELHTIHVGAWLNLLDYSLVASLESVLVDYVVAGKEVLRPDWLRVRQLRLSPGFNYTITPSGPQYRINCRLGTAATAGNVYARWTQTLQDPGVFERARTMEQEAARRGQTIDVAVPSVVRLVGAGGDIRWTRDAAVSPGIAAEAWRDTNKRLAGRAEVGITYRERWLGDTRAVRVAIGGKSAGYSAGYPLARGFYVTAALLADF